MILLIERRKGDTDTSLIYQTILKGYNSYCFFSREIITFFREPLLINSQTILYLTSQSQHFLKKYK